MSSFQFSSHHHAFLLSKIFLAISSLQSSSDRHQFSLLKMVFPSHSHFPQIFISFFRYRFVFAISSFQFSSDLHELLLLKVFFSSPHSNLPHVIAVFLSYPCTALDLLSSFSHIATIFPSAFFKYMDS